MKLRTVACGALAALLATATVTKASTGAAAAPSQPSAASATAGSRIAFSYGYQFPGGDDIHVHSDVYTVAPDGSDLRQITHITGDESAAMPSWSPTGERIAFQSTVTGNAEIWVMDRDGGHSRQVTHDSGVEDLEPSWAPDDLHIVFERCAEPFGFLAKCDLAVVAADGTGERTIVAGNRYHVHAVVSPDGTQLAFASDREGLVSAIWVVGLDGRGLHRVTAPDTLAFWPAWTPDSRRITFTDHCCLPHSNVWSVRPDGSDLQRITNAAPGHNAMFQSTSPDGRELLYNSDEAYPDGCCVDLVVRHADGSHSTILSGSPTLFAADWGPAPRHVASNDVHLTAVADSAAATPANSPAAPITRAAAVPPVPASAPTRIAFGDYTTGQIYAASPDGTGLVQLTHTDASYAAAYPDVAPDGRTIAYARLPQFGAHEARIWVADADGAHAHQLPGEAPGFRDYRPRFTPDGRQIVFSRCEPGDGVCAIWIMRRDGSQRRAITAFHEGDDEAVDFGADVSSDGRHVAFARFGWRGISAQVFVIGIDGRDEHAVTPAWLEASSPAYSPDGQQLSVTSQSPRLGSNIYSLRADGTQLRRLTDTAYPNSDVDPSYSPTGDRIAFASDRRYDDYCCVDLFTMNADGSAQRRVALELAGISSPSWGIAGDTASTTVNAVSGTAPRSAAPQRGTRARLVAPGVAVRATRHKH